MEAWTTSLWSKKFNEILRVPRVPWLFFAQIKVLNDLLPGSTIPLLSRKSLTGVGKAGCPLPGWGCRGEVALWISAESCLVGEGHRKGAVLKVLPSCRTASWHLEMMAAQPSWRTQAVISRTFILLPDGTWYLFSGWMSAQLKTGASSLASMPPGHSRYCPGPALSLSLSCSEAFRGFLVLCETKSDCLFETLHDLAPGQCLPSSPARSFLSL